MLYLVRSGAELTLKIQGKLHPFEENNVSLSLATEMIKINLLRQTYYFCIWFLLSFEKYGICQLATFQLRPFAFGSRAGATGALRPQWKGTDPTLSCGPSPGTASTKLLANI